MAGEADEAFELRFAPATGDGPEIPDTVVVHRTTAHGPGGHWVYTDASGIVRAEISDRGEVRMMATSAWQVPLRPIASHPVGAHRRKAG
jgi:Family of unknown function (DUF6296)